MTSLGLENKVAIVTGGARNIGRAIVLELARSGANVVIADIQHAKARKVALEVERLKRRALAVETDVRDKTQIARMVALAVEKFSRVDILVNNAAIVGFPTPIETLTVEHWDRMQEVSLRSAFLCAQAVLPSMKRLGKGKIINISSVVFWVGAKNASAYVAAKGGLIGLTRSLARDLGEHKINVNAITPGAVKTPAEVKIATQEDIARIVNSQCLKRRVLPGDIARVALFLASDLSDAMTGQTLNVDAGWAFH